MSLSDYRLSWSARPAREMLAGAVATFALIPEVIAFSFAAGVDPQVGLYASFVISIVIALFGARPAMISAAAGSVALVAAPLVQAHGLAYLLAAGVLAGILQVVFGVVKLGSLMRFVSQSVRKGFVNALAILIFAAQLPHIIGGDLWAYGMLAAGLGVIYLAPVVTKAVPSPLICILILTAAAIAFDLPVMRVADLGRLPDSLPVFGWIEVPLTWQTLQIIAGPALAIAMVGLLESMMTASVVDAQTQTTSDKNRECTGLGLANIASSLFGGIAGCGMIGQSVSNVKYGGRGRLSTAFAGVFLLVLMVILKPWVSQVPVAALVAIMVMVSIDTFDWSSLRSLARMPKLSSAVMLATVAVTVASANLALGVMVGVVLSGLFFALKVAQAIQVERRLSAAGVAYHVTGQVFFASADGFLAGFDAERDVVAAAQAGSDVVRVDLTGARFWDVSAVAALEDLVALYQAKGLRLDLSGLTLPDALSSALRAAIGR